MFVHKKRTKYKNFTWMAAPAQLPTAKVKLEEVFELNKWSRRQTSAGVVGCRQGQVARSGVRDRVTGGDMQFIATTTATGLDASNWSGTKDSGNKLLNFTFFSTCS